MWTNLTFRGFDTYGSVMWRQRLPAQPHVVSVCTVPPTEEVLTLSEAKLRANFTWPSPDERDEMIEDFIRAARAYVENYTSLALLTQTRVVSFDVLDSPVIILPEHSFPLQAVTSVVVTDTDGTKVTLDDDEYAVDFATGRIFLDAVVSYPLTVRAFSGWAITIEAGWIDGNDLRDHVPDLFHAVGLLVAHYCTLGRDLASIERGTLDMIPQGFTDLLAAYVPVYVI